jgi:hypothetical protein
MPPHSGHCTGTRWWTDCAREHAYSTVLAGRAAPVDDADADDEAEFEEAAAFERRASLERLVRRRSARLRLKKDGPMVRDRVKKSGVENRVGEHSVSFTFLMTHCENIAALDPQECIVCE